MTLSRMGRRRLPSRSRNTFSNEDLFIDRNKASKLQGQASSDANI